VSTDQGVVVIENAADMKEGARDRAERMLLGLLLFGSLGAVAGGMLLIVKPDGSLLQAKLSVLAGTPFHDWRVPGILLGTLVGGGGLGSYGWLLMRFPLRKEVAILYALGLLGFEMAEWAWIGPQALEFLFGLLALVMLSLALASGSLSVRVPRGRLGMAPTGATALSRATDGRSVRSKSARPSAEPLQGRVDRLRMRGGAAPDARSNLVCSTHGSSLW